MSEEMSRNVLTLINIEKVGDDYFVFNFEMPKGIAYKEGQYGAFKHVDNDIEGRTVRAFSYASASYESVFKIGTKIVENPSDFKAKMKDLKQENICLQKMINDAKKEQALLKKAINSLFV